jgi:3-dehydroquinate dehydratase
VIADLATVRVSGKGADGYLEAVDALAAIAEVSEP